MAEDRLALVILPSSSVMAVTFSSKTLSLLLLPPNRSNNDENENENNANILE